MEKGSGDRVKSIFCDLILRSPFPGSEVVSEASVGPIPVSEPLGVSEPVPIRL